jgi:hypothetical protein
MAGEVFGEFQAQLRGYLVQFQMSGSGNADEPEVTNVVAVVDIQSGRIPR